MVNAVFCMDLKLPRGAKRGSRPWNSWRMASEERRQREQAAREVHREASERRGWALNRRRYAGVEL